MAIAILLLFIMNFLIIRFIHSRTLGTPVTDPVLIAIIILSIAALILEFWLIRITS